MVNSSAFCKDGSPEVVHDPPIALISTWGLPGARVCTYVRT